MRRKVISVIWGMVLFIIFTIVPISAVEASEMEDRENSEALSGKYTIDDHVYVENIISEGTENKAGEARFTCEKCGKYYTIYYRIDNENAIIGLSDGNIYTSGKGTAETLVIPAYIDNREVKSIYRGSFVGCEAKKIIISNFAHKF